jgi:hypothetical protein
MERFEMAPERTPWRNRRLHAAPPASSGRTPDNTPADIRFAANEAIIFLPMTGVPDLHEEFVPVDGNSEP